MFGNSSLSSFVNEIKIFLKQIIPLKWIFHWGTLQKELPELIAFYWWAEKQKGGGTYWEFNDFKKNTQKLEPILHPQVYFSESGLIP